MQKRGRKKVHAEVKVVSTVYITSEESRLCLLNRFWLEVSKWWLFEQQTTGPKPALDTILMLAPE